MSNLKYSWCSISKVVELITYQSNSQRIGISINLIGIMIFHEIVSLDNITLSNFI